MSCSAEADAPKVRIDQVNAAQSSAGEIVDLRDRLGSERQDVRLLGLALRPALKPGSLGSSSLTLILFFASTIALRTR